MQKAKIQTKNKTKTENETKAEVAKIAEKLANLIDREVEIKSNQSIDLSGRLAEFRSELSNYLLKAKTLSRELKTEGFTFNAVEQEGYLRALTLISNLAEDYFGVRKNTETEM